MPLIPRAHTFEDLLVELAEHVLASVNLLAEMLGQDEAGRTTLAAQVAEHESGSADVSRRIAHRINDSLVTPFDREDLLALAHSAHQCMTRVELAADLMALLRLGDLSTQVQELLAVLQRQAELSVAVMAGLSRGKDQAEYWVEVGRLRHRGDQVYRRALADLLNDGVRVHGSVESLLKRREVLDRLEAAVDSFDRLANHVEMIAVKES